jgi:uncharacterized HAD superfamily protein
MNYVSYKRLSQDLLKFSRKLPDDYDGIFGVPRSGLIPAAMLAFLKHIPCGSIHDLITKSNIHISNRMSKISDKTLKKVLVVDDCISGGSAMADAKKRLSGVKGVKIEYCAIYSSRPGESRVQYCYKRIPFPRVFEWNIFNSGNMEKAGVDIDGVICEDPPFLENDQKQMRNYYLNAPTLYLPRYKAKALITSRLHKNRDVTEQYMKKHRVKYDHLIMSPYNTPSERRKANKNGENKAKAALKLGCKWFIESDPTQAKIIKQVAKIPVFCTHTMELI